MKSEMGYKFTGAGHEQPEGKRKYEQPDGKLTKAFEEYLKQGNRKSPAEDYEYAAPLISGIETTVDQAHALLVKYQDHPEIGRAGPFISAVYNKSPDKVIVCDLNTQVSYLACLLDRKTFINNGIIGGGLGFRAIGNIINNGKTQNHFGDQAQGNIINNGDTENWMGKHAKGNIINNGTTNDEMGYDAQGNIINNGTTSILIGWKAKGNIINNGTTSVRMCLEAEGNMINLGEAKGKKRISVPELKQYLDNLKAQLTNPNMGEVLKVLEGLTTESLDKDITDILNRSGRQS